MIRLTERDDRVKLAVRCNSWLTELPRELSVRAVVTGSPGSVVFGYDDTPSFQTENVSPYALGGDSPAGDYNPVTIGTGVHTLIAPRSPLWPEEERPVAITPSSSRS